MDHGNRRPPVALPGNSPIAKPVIDRGFSDTFFFQKFANRSARFLADQAIEGTGIHHSAIGGERLHHSICIQLTGFRLNDYPDGQMILPGKIQIPLVVSRNGHDCAGTITHENEIGCPYRNGFSRQRIYGISSGKHAFLFAGPGDGVLFFYLLHACQDGFFLFGAA